MAFLRKGCICNRLWVVSLGNFTTLNFFYYSWSLRWENGKENKSERDGSLIWGEKNDPFTSIFNWGTKPISRRTQYFIKMDLNWEILNIRWSPQFIVVYIFPHFFSVTLSLSLLIMIYLLYVYLLPTFKEQKSNA